MRTPASCCQVRQRACAAHRRRARSRVVSLFGGREVVVPVADDLVCMLDDCREANDVEEEVDGERCALAVLDVIVLARRIHPLRAPPAPKQSEHESARSGRAAAGQRQGSGRAAAEQRQSSGRAAAHAVPSTLLRKRSVPSPHQSARAWHVLVCWVRSCPCGTCPNKKRSHGVCLPPWQRVSRPSIHSSKIIATLRAMAM